MFRSFLYGDGVRVALRVQEASQEVLADSEGGVFVTSLVRDNLSESPWYSRLNLDFSNVSSAWGSRIRKASLREGVDQIERLSPMQTECTKLFEFDGVDRRAVVAGFDGGDITSNAGGLLLGLVDRGLGLVRRFAECFRDRRNPSYVEHQVETIVGQRIFGLVLGYGDLNDHDELRRIPVFKTLAVSWPRCCVRGLRGFGRQEHTQSC